MATTRYLTCTFEILYENEGPSQKVVIDIQKPDLYLTSSVKYWLCSKLSVFYIMLMRDIQIIKFCFTSTCTGSNELKKVSGKC